MTSANRPVALLDPLNYPIHYSWNDTAMRGDNDGGSNLIYIGKARPGSAEGDLVWQIRKLAYDANGNVTSITWPQNSNSHASNDYEFSWTARATYTYA